MINVFPMMMFMMNDISNDYSYNESYDDYDVIINEYRDELHYRYGISIDAIKLCDSHVTNPNELPCYVRSFYYNLHDNEAKKYYRLFKDLINCYDYKSVIQLHPYYNNSKSIDLIKMSKEWLYEINSKDNNYVGLVEFIWERIIDYLDFSSYHKVTSTKRSTTQLERYLIVTPTMYFYYVYDKGMIEY